MGYQENWDRLTSHPEWNTLTPKERAQVARSFAQKYVRKEVKGNSPQMQSFLQSNVFDVEDQGKAKPAPPRPELPLIGTMPRMSDVAAETGNTLKAVAGNPLGTGKAVVKGLVDESMSGQLRRAGRRADKAMGLNKTARDDGRAFTPITNPSREEEVGLMLGQMLDPLAIAMPANLLTKTMPALPLAKQTTGIGANLLPKAAPKMLPVGKEALKGAVGTAGTGYGVNAATSALSDLNEGQAIDLKRANEAGLLGAAIGAPLGALAHASAAGKANKQIKQVDKNVKNARAALAGHNGNVRDVTVTKQTIDSVNAAHALAADMALPTPRNLSPDDAEAILARHQRRTLTPGLLPDDLAASVSQDFIGPSVELPRPGLGSAAFAGPRPQAMTPTPPKPVYNTLGASPEQLAAHASQDFIGPDALVPRIGGEAYAGPRPKGYTPGPVKPPEVEPGPYMAGGLTPEQMAARASSDYLLPSAEAMPDLPGLPPQVQAMLDAQSPKTPAELAQVVEMAQPASPPPRNVWKALVSEQDGSFDLNALLDAADEALSRVREWQARLKQAPTLEASQGLKAAKADHLKAITAYANAWREKNPQVVEKFGRLLNNEAGAYDPEAAHAALKDFSVNVGDLALKGAHLAGQGYKAATEAGAGAINGLVDKGLEAIGKGDARTAVNVWWQAMKQAPTDNFALHGLKKAFISNYGVPPEVLALADDAARQARRVATPMRKKAYVYLNQLNGEQQELLELAITEPAMRDSLIAQIARELGTGRKVVEEMVTGTLEESTRLTTLLKEVGAVSESGAARWEGQYLPRTYEKHFPTVSKFFAKSNAIKGKQGRGMEKVVSASPETIAKYKAEGWEHVGDSGDKAVMWRDYTLAERQDMEQLFHASNAMAKMADEFERDFRNGRLLADIVKGSDEAGAFAIPKGSLKEPPQGYTLFSSANVPKTGIKRWGALADHYVRDDVAHYLTWASDNSAVTQTLRNVKQWTGLNLFKRLKTIWNPAHYLNNAMQNVPMLELAGASVGDLPAVLKETLDQGELFQRLEDFGTIRNGQVAHDLAVSLEGQWTGTGTPMDVARNVLRSVQHLERKGIYGLGGTEFAQATDDLFRMALVKAKMAEGMAFEEAARLAEETFYDSSKVTAPAAQVMEAFAVPFAKVLWYQADRLPQLLISNPGKAAMLLTYFQGAKFLIDRLNGTTDEEAQARDRLVPDHLKAPLGLGYIPLPGKDSKGNQLLLNTANWSPLSFLDNSDQAKLAYYPSSLMPGGPMMVGAQALGNFDIFRQKQLRTGTEDRTGDFLLQNLAPGFVGRADTLRKAMRGEVSYSGLPYDVPTAAAGMIGVKAQPYAPLLGVTNLEKEFARDEREIQGRIRQYAQMAAQNPQDAAHYQALIEQEAAKLQARAQKLAEEMRQAAPALKGAMSP